MNCLIIALLFTCLVFDVYLDNLDVTLRYIIYHKIPKFADSLFEEGFRVTEHELGAKIQKVHSKFGKLHQIV